MAATVQSFIDQLTLNHRVMLLGGVAVIAHGYSRHTQDADIWLDPMSSAEEWADAVLSVCTTFKGATIHRLPGWTEVIGMQLASAVEETGMVRILGLDCPLDIFRRPNEFDSVVRADYKNRLPTASLEEAEMMLSRYSEWQVLVPALQNPSPEVRELAMTHLREFAAAGDPFSQAILEGRELP